MLYGLIENTKANEYVRGQALNALVILVLHGLLPIYSMNPLPYIPCCISAAHLVQFGEVILHCVNVNVKRGESFGIKATI